MKAALPPSQPESSADSTNGWYDAFISYRHVEPDRGWAKWLHTALETYRIPTALARQKRLPPRLARVFRDEEELAASASLHDRIEQALRRSRTLIIICSPRTPQSLWVNTEVQRFRELGRHERILALLIEGEPRDSFPQALREIRRKVVDASGVAGEQIEEVEPLAADVRPRRDESPRHLRRMAKLRLIACILDVRFDDLRQRHQERRARQLRYFSIAGAVLALLMAALAVAAAAFSPDGNRLLAGYTDGPVRLWELAKGKEIRCFTGHTQAVLAVTFADDGKLAASGSSDTTVRLWQIEQNQALATLTGHTGAVLSVASAGSLLVSGDGAVFLWDLSNQQRRLLGKADAPVTGVALAADGRSALSVTGAETVLWDVSSGQHERTFQQPKTLANGAAFDPRSVFATAAFTPDRQRILRASGR